MKANYIGLKFWRNLWLMLSVPFFFVFFFFSQTKAQPGGCYADTWKMEMCRQERNALLQKFDSEIKNLDRRISREPKNAELYYQRGKIRSAMMFEKNLGFRTIEFDGTIYFTEIDSKALADYTQAINLSPKAEYFEARGDIYRAYWKEEVSQIGSVEKKTKEEILKIVERVFLGNENFNAAQRDFQKTVELSASHEMSLPSRGRLEDIHYTRAFSLGRAEFHFASVIGREKAADVALADQDYVIDFYKSVYARNKNSWEKNRIYDALLDKGKMADNFGKVDLALEIFNEAEKYWTINNSSCFVFTNRAKIHLKRNDFEAALRELTFALDNGGSNCRSVAEFRGDIYFRQGEWKPAIQDYTVFLNIRENSLFVGPYIKRGTAYLKLGEAEKAVADFDYAIEKLFNKHCKQFFLMRAEGYKKAGKPDLAAADEQTAAKLPVYANYSGCQIDLLK